jgi:uncharacterized RDD family membrane protein YckC
VFCSICGAPLKPGDRFCQKCGQTVGAASPVAYAAQSGGLPIGPTGTPYAGFWLRFVAEIVDGLILGIPIGLIVLACFMAFGGAAWFHAHQNMGSDSPEAVQFMMAFMGAMFAYFALIIVTLVAINWLYYSLMESSAHQATLGKMALGLRVTDMNGQRLSFAHATGRFFAKVLDRMIPLYIGFIMAGFTQKKQALHDMIAATLVVRNQ